MIYRTIAATRIAIEMCSASTMRSPQEPRVNRSCMPLARMGPTTRCGAPSLASVTEIHGDPLAKRKVDATFAAEPDGSHPPARQPNRRGVSPGEHLSVARRAHTVRRRDRPASSGRPAARFSIGFMRQGGSPREWSRVSRASRSGGTLPYDHVGLSGRSRVAPFFGRLGARAGSLPGVPRAAAFAAGGMTSTCVRVTSVS